MLTPNHGLLAGREVVSDMTWAKYQEEARKTWQPVDTAHYIVYPALGLADEAGEVAGKVKKIMRDHDGYISLEDRDALKYELGDVLWYLTQIATELGLSMEEVATANIAKLADRQRRGVINGNGDNR